MKENMKPKAKKWNENAIKALYSKRLPPPRSDYLKALYVAAMEEGMKYVNKTSIFLLKTDLWNEGIERERNVLDSIICKKGLTTVGLDMSHTVCFYTKKNSSLMIVEGDIRSLPFKYRSFDIILDLSTIDHIPLHEALCQISKYKDLLKREGILVMIFDYYGLLWRISNFIRKMIRGVDSLEESNAYAFPITQIRKEVYNDFDILHESCMDIIGWIWNGATQRILKLPQRFLSFFLKFEFSNMSKHMKPFARQYLIIGRVKEHE
jgi:SAM-dependent methyltransferase